MRFEYSSNNSGGRWWLKDEHWKALETAGWKVDWAKDSPNKLFVAKNEGRYLGALATSATKDFPTLKDAIKEWESVTGLEVTDEGCNCCGPPHTFRWGRALSENPAEEYGYASGEGLLEYMYDKVPASLREAAESLSSK